VDPTTGNVPLRLQCQVVGGVSCRDPIRVRAARREDGYGKGRPPTMRDDRRALPARLQHGTVAVHASMILQKSLRQPVADFTRDMMGRIFFWLGGAIVLSGFLLSSVMGLHVASEADWSAHANAGSERKVRILRDKFGVPHVYGKTDADVAFGLAYAHAEDDFRTIQQSIMTSRGRLSLSEDQLPRLVNAASRAMGLADMFTMTGGDPMVTDYLVQLLKVRARVEAGYDDNLARGLISRGTHEVLVGYAEGLNLFAARHPDKVLPGFEPVTHRDIAAGFAFFLPLFFGFDRQLRELFEPERRHETSFPEGSGSNAMAIAP